MTRLFPRRCIVVTTGTVAVSVSLAFSPAAFGNATTESAYDETAGLYGVVESIASFSDTSGSVEDESLVHRDAATDGGQTSRSSGEDHSESSQRIVARLGVEQAVAPFTPRDAGMMGLAAAVLAGSGAVTFATGLVRGRKHPERYDEI